MTNNSPKTEVQFPKRDYMAADEVVAWITSGKALHRFEWPDKLFHLSRNWRFHDAVGIATEDPPRSFLALNQWHSSSRELLEVFRARFRGDLWPKYPRIKSEEGLAFATHYLNLFQINEPAKWKDLGVQLKSDIDIIDRHVDELKSASGKLRRELFNGRIAAWGSRNADDPFNGPPRQKIPKEEWPPGIEISFSGNVREREGWDHSIRWMLLVFDSQDIIDMWPHKIDGETSRDPSTPVTHPNASVDSVNEWMQKYVRAETEKLRGPPKREVSLKACQVGTGCTYRQARAAWEALPAEIKRPPRSRKVAWEQC